MGNRPQGAKRMYMATLISYAVIMAYTTFAALYIVIYQLTTHAVEPVKKGTSAYQLGNNIFTNLIVSTISTTGLYFLMSFLYLDPWHMFTSSAQYFALLPSYICTLQVYAFCNTHDISWGTKGDNVMHTDLGTAKSTANGTVEVEMPSEQLDIDSGYDVALRNLRDRLEVLVAPVSEFQQQEDYYKGVRTYMVAVWITCNTILVMAVSEAYSSTHVADNFYLKFILWSVASLALFRALGSSAFGVINIISMIAEGRIQDKFGKWFGGDKDERMAGTLAGTMSDNGKTAKTSGTESSIGSSISDAFSKISNKLTGRG
jgi:chitin synthase